MLNCCRNHQGRFSGVGAVKGAGNGCQAAETLRASQAVQTTDVMVNLTHWQVQKKPCGAFFVMLMRKLLLLRIHFLNVIVHNRSELHWCLDVWNWRVGSAGTFNYDRPIIKDSS